MGGRLKRAPMAGATRALFQSASGTRVTKSVARATPRTVHCNNDRCATSMAPGIAGAVAGLGKLVVLAAGTGVVRRRHAGRRLCWTGCFAPSAWGQQQLLDTVPLVVVKVTDRYVHVPTAHMSGVAPGVYMASGAVSACHRIYLVQIQEHSEHQMVLPSL